MHAFVAGIQVSRGEGLRTEKKKKNESNNVFNRDVLIGTHFSVTAVALPGSAFTVFR
jgi:hypothetical protein